MFLQLTPTANAMKVFPKVVKDYLEANDERHAKPEDIFDIITVAGLDVGYRGVKLVGGFTASITYAESWEYQTALDSAKVGPRYQALLNLLATTEALLAERFEDGREFMDDMGMVQNTGGIFDKAFLA